MFKRAFVQEEGGGRMISEMRLLKEAFEGRGLPVVLFTARWKSC